MCTLSTVYNTVYHMFKAVCNTMYEAGFKLCCIFLRAPEDAVTEDILGDSEVPMYPISAETDVFPDSSIVKVPL